MGQFYSLPESRSSFFRHSPSLSSFIELIKRHFVRLTIMGSQQPLKDPLESSILVDSTLNKESLLNPVSPSSMNTFDIKSTGSDTQLSLDSSDQFSDIQHGKTSIHRNKQAVKREKGGRKSSQSNLQFKMKKQPLTHSLEKSSESTIVAEAHTAQLPPDETDSWGLEEGNLPKQTFKTPEDLSCVAHSLSTLTISGESTKEEEVKSVYSGSIQNRGRSPKRKQCVSHSISGTTPSKFPLAPSPAKSSAPRKGKQPKETEQRMKKSSYFKKGDPRPDCQHFMNGVCIKGARCNHTHDYSATSLSHLCLLLDYQIGMTYEMWTRLDRIERSLNTTPSGHLNPSRVLSRSGSQARGRCRSLSRSSVDQQRQGRTATRFEEYYIPSASSEPFNQS